MWSSSCSTNDGRFDSATSLPPPVQSISRNSSTTPGSPADDEVAKPVVPYQALKSSRRIAMRSYLSSHLPRASASIHTRPNPSPRRLNTVISVPGSFFASPAHLTLDDASSSASSDTLTSGNADKVSCTVCGRAFTGKYARGNLGRHMRQFHKSAGLATFDCQIDGCLKTFARQDARLKHQRAHHSGPHINSSISPIDLDEVPVSIQTSLRDIHTRLDDEMYTQVCDMFLYLLPRIVQYLRDTGSNTYDIYLDVLEEVLAAVDAVDSGSLDSINQVTADPSLLSRPRHGRSTSSGKGKGFVLNLGSSSMSRTDSNHPYGAQKPNYRRENSSPNHKVAKSNQNESPLFRPVDCPDHKYYRINLGSRTSPCRGCRAKNMAEVRYHLKRINHQGRSGTWKCPFCKKDFNDKRSMDEHIEAKSCQTQVHHRGDIIRPWAMLFLTRHPEARKIPSPYCDEHTYLPQAIWEECRASLQDTTSSSQDNMLTGHNSMSFSQGDMRSGQDSMSFGQANMPNGQDFMSFGQDSTTSVPDTSTPFSGHTENSMSGQINQMMYDGTNNSRDVSYQAAVHFANQMLLSIASSMSNNLSTILPSSSTTGFSGDCQPDPNLLWSYIARRHNTLVSNVAQYLASLAQPPELQAPDPYFDMGQIPSMANQAEMVVYNAYASNQFQPPHSQDQGQDDSNAGSSLPSGYIFGSSTIQTPLFPEQHEPSHNQSFHAPNNNQYSTATMSTRSSQTGVPTNSYPTQPSPTTNPSSAYAPTNSIVHSAANSPHHYRRRSGNSDISECHIPPLIQPDREGLLETPSLSSDSWFTEAERPQPTHIDPRMLLQPQDHRHQYDEGSNVGKR